MTLILGWKNKKQPTGPIELDLEAGNLVITLIIMPTQTYSEFKHSLKAIQISKLELFQFSAISSDKLMV